MRMKAFRNSAASTSEVVRMEHGPAAVLALDASEVGSDPGLPLGRDAVHVVLQKHVLGRDGGSRLQLEHPVAVAVLPTPQGATGASDGTQGVGRGEARLRGHGIGPSGSGVGSSEGASARFFGRGGVRSEQLEDVVEGVLPAGLIQFDQAEPA